MCAIVFSRMERRPSNQSDHNLETKEPLSSVNCRLLSTVKYKHICRGSFATGRPMKCLNQRLWNLEAGNSSCGQASAHMPTVRFSSSTETVAQSDCHIATQHCNSIQLCQVASPECDSTSPYDLALCGGPPSRLPTNTNLHYDHPRPFS